MIRLFCIALIVFTFVGLAAQSTMIHQPAMTLEAGRPVSLTLEYNGDIDQVVKTEVFVRTIGEPSYTLLEMERASGVRPVYKVTLPQEMIKPVGIEYYFVVTHEDGSVATLPEVQPDGNPFRVIGGRAPEASGGDEGFVLLSPEPGDVEPGEPLMIAISTFALADNLDPSKIKFIVNGQDMTGQAVVSDNLVVLTIDKPKPGPMSFQVTGTTKDGKQIQSKPWTSKVKSKSGSGLPMNLNGRIATSGSILSLKAEDSSLMEDKDERNADLDFTMSGRQNWFGFDTRVYLSSREKKYDQPVDRFRLGLHVPHLDVAIGDDSPNYSTFSLNNKNIRGIHARLQNLDLGLLVDYGESKRQVDGSFSTEVNEATDSTSITLNKAGTFSRKTLGMRLELGNIKKMKLGLSVVKTKDDVNSLDANEFTDANNNRLVTPQDNLVIDTDFTLFMMRQRWTLGVEAAMSLYNRDITDGTMSKDELEETYGISDLPFDPKNFEKYLVINQNMEPFKPGTDCMSERFFTTLNVYNNFLNVSYTLVGSAFNSLSANYLSKDTRTLSVTDNVSLFRNRANLTLGFNQISDNLSDSKDRTSNSTQIFGQFLVHPDGLPTFKLGYQTSGVKDDAERDSVDTMIDQVSNHLSVGLIHDLNNIPNAPTRIGVSFDQSTNQDKLNNTIDNTLNTVAISAQTDFANLPLSTNISYSMNMDNKKTRDYNAVETVEAKDNYHALGLRGDLRFFDNRLTPFAEWQLTTMSGDSDSQNRNLIQFGTGYKVTDALYLFTELGLLSFSNDENDDENYDKTDWRMKATYKF